MTELQFIGMVFESFIIVIAVILLSLVYIKYTQKKHRLTLTLFVIFLNYSIAIVFSWLSKVLVLYSGIEYIYNDTIPDPQTIDSWVLYRIIDFRISFVFLTIAIFLSYILKVNVFEKGYNKVLRISVFIYTLFTLAYTILIYQRGNTLLDVFAFLLIFIFMAVIYIPFLLRALQSYKSTDNETFKSAFLSLALMCIAFILI
ncbi:MAG: hypothetical protein ACFFKA_12415, partial [Candidatus Thorarchaeota archaeon]